MYSCMWVGALNAVCVSSSWSYGCGLPNIGSGGAVQALNL